MKKFILFLLFFIGAGCITQEPIPDSKLTEEDITPLDDFFVMDIGFRLQIDVEEWTLKVTGMVNTPLELTYQDILSYPSHTQITHLYCMPGFEGVGKWTGVPVKILLEEAGYSPDTVHVVFYAKDGFSSSIPLEKALQEDTILAYEMNDITLPQIHGFPLRLVVPGKVGYKWVKWIVKIELVDYEYRGYWESQGYSNEGDLFKT
jgi:DMSO/TMAO reductase YedYZ molybdopterin-dependent catalytic subunit